MEIRQRILRIEEEESEARFNMNRIKEKIHETDSLHENVYILPVYSTHATRIDQPCSTSQNKVNTLTGDQT